MQNKLFLLILPFAAILLAVQGCSFPGVYKINVQQGNIVTEDMLVRLKPGMTRKQVHFALGNPVIENVFDSSEENFLYTYQQAGGDIEYQRVTIYYNDDIYLRHEAQLLEDHPAY